MLGLQRRQYLIDLHMDSIQPYPQILTQVGSADSATGISSLDYETHELFPVTFNLVCYLRVRYDRSIVRLFRQGWKWMTVTYPLACNALE